VSGYYYGPITADMLPDTPLIGLCKSLMTSTKYHEHFDPQNNRNLVTILTTPTELWRDADLGLAPMAIFEPPSGSKLSRITCNMLHGAVIVALVKLAKEQGINFTTQMQNVYMWSVIGELIYYYILRRNGNVVMDGG
jgi:hypothetical protein